MLREQEYKVLPMPPAIMKHPWTLQVPWLPIAPGTPGAPFTTGRNEKAEAIDPMVSHALITNIRANNPIQIYLLLNFWECIFTIIMLNVLCTRPSYSRSIIDTIRAVITILLLATSAQSSFDLGP